MPTIRCGNCGGDHPSVAEVRACHAGRPSSPDAPVARRDSEPIEARSTRTSAPATALVQRAAPADGWAGPDELGRWIVVAVDGTVPVAWAEAPRVRIDRLTLLDPTDALDVLADRWMHRQRTVIELDIASLERGLDTDRETTAPWFLDPTFVFAGDRLRHLIWSNSVDGRDAAAPRWHWDEVAAGIDDRSPIDGAGVWYDGGPIGRPMVAGDVVHRISLERGGLTALGLGSATADLADDQLAAVAHGGGAARIIAPAGSGKTRVLTERARHLLRDWHLPAEALTLVAFNVRAADEIRARTRDLPGLQIRTLNALALAIVQRVAGRRVTTINERDVRRILDGLVKFPRKTNTDPAQAWLDAFSLIRLGLRPPAEVEAMFDGDVAGLTEVFPRYREVLADRDSVDFDEQIVMAITLLLTEPPVRAAAQRMARILLVDEFQDLTPAHLLLVRLLASPDLAVFGVGDDDQTIYGYAGATPEWLIGFDRLFPGAGDHPLHVNYRCPTAIVTAAATLLTHNRRRVPKEIIAPPTRSDDPSALVVIADDDTTSSTVRTVTDALADGATPADIAVLSRVTAGLAPVQIALGHHGIATTGAVDERYLDRTGVRAVLAWLRIAVDPNRLRGADLESTIRRPSRGLSGRVAEWVAECKNVEGLARLSSRLTSERDADKVAGYVSDIQLVASLASSGARTAELLAVVRSRVGLDDAMAKLDRSRADAQASHLDDLDALASLAHLHPEPATFAEWLRDELARPSDPEGVTLASIHRVKGREWPVVVVHDVRDGVLPHRLADDREEERRIFHVGITRASQRAVVVADGAASSPFLAEMDEVYVPPAPGAARRSTASATTSTASIAVDGGLREQLKEWRRARAEADAVPAYVVFTNVTLDALASAKPTSLDELRRIPGIGPAKRERYGEAIVELIRGSG